MGCCDDSPFFALHGKVDNALLGPENSGDIPPLSSLG
jgi:hypothetical protein